MTLFWNFKDGLFNNIKSRARNEKKQFRVLIFLIEKRREEDDKIENKKEKIL